MQILIPIPSKVVTKGEGSFFCPSCQRTAKYHIRERVARYLMFFVAVVEGDILEVFVECSDCRMLFPPEFLRKMVTNDVDIVKAMKERLLAGISTQNVREDLYKSGLDEKTVEKYLRVALGIFPKRCVQCDSTYHSAITKCSRCGVFLPGKS